MTHDSSIHVILRVYCKKNDADIRRSKNCLEVHRIASLLNRKVCISALNNCSWRRVKAFKSRIEQKTGFPETMRNVVQMVVENEFFFMFLSLLFCNNKSTAPFINFLSRHQTFIELFPGNPGNLFGSYSKGKVGLNLHALHLRCDSFK